eukprot:359338-Chlamydomonas_euryale.AAC.1
MEGCAWKGAHGRVRMEGCACKGAHGRVRMEACAWKGARKGRARKGRSLCTRPLVLCGTPHSRAKLGAHVSEQTVNRATAVH